jgi:hypothetical protein
MTFEEAEEVAAMLGAGGEDWAVAKLRENAKLIGYHTGTDNDDVERLMFESALHLRDWLPLYLKLEQDYGEECPLFIHDALNMLDDELIPFLAEQIKLPRDGRPPDSRLRLCAAVCLGIWRRVKGAAQPYSEKLWEACEAYWVACDHPSSPKGNVKKWQRLLEWAASDHHITTPE